MNRFRILNIIFLLGCFISVQASLGPDTLFSQEDHDYYMNLIEELNPGFYKQLIQCETETGEPCIRKKEANLKKVLQYLQGYPIFFISSTLKDVPLEVQKEFLNNFIQLLDYNYYYRTSIYPHYMSLIKEIDANAHERLKKCTEETGDVCIREVSGQRFDVIPGNPKTGGYPIMIVPADLKWYPQLQKNALEVLVKTYNTFKIASTSSPSERIKILEIIKSIAPDLYDQIYAVDPDASNHVEIIDEKGGASVVPLSDDGLPLIRISSGLMELPAEELRFVIAHELGHYALSHSIAKIIPYKLSHANLAIPSSSESNTFLPFEKTFRLAYNREQENEADKFAILDLGIPADDGIAYAKREMTEEEETSSKKTFTTTHPFWAARMRHLEQLKREVEVRGSRPSIPIDWQGLAKAYLEAYAERYK